MPSGQDYSNQLRKEAGQDLSPHINSLKEDLRNSRISFLESLVRIEDRVHALETIELSGIQNLVAETVRKTAQESDQEWASLAQFAADLRKQETQEDILGLLLDAAHYFAPRVALFVAKGTQLTGWSARGFAESIAAQIRSCSFSPSQNPPLHEALILGSSIPMDAIDAKMVFSGLPVDEVQGQWRAFPMIALQRPIALLLVSESHEQGCRIDALFAIVSLTQLCIENIALRILREMDVQRQKARPSQLSPSKSEIGAAKENVPDRTQPQVADLAELPATVMGKSGEVSVASKSEVTGTIPSSAGESDLPSIPSGLDEFPKYPIPQEEPPFVEALLEETSVSQSGEPAMETTEPDAEVVSAVDMEPVEPSPDLSLADLLDHETQFVPIAPDVVREPVQPTAPPMPAAAPESAATLSEIDEAAQRIAEEEKLHSDARRFARLLVSEIKLYNESRVIEGRENKDIYLRLKRDIDRSREMYEKRAALSVTRKIDYFHDEVLRILGGNDPATLGDSYPGPRVGS